MKEVVIVFIVRILIGCVYCGFLNNIKLFIMMGYVIQYVVVCFGVDGGEIDDVVIGVVLMVGIVGNNLVRMVSLVVGFFVIVFGQIMDC